MLLAVGVAATATLGFWLAASGDVIGAVLIAAGVLALAAPAGACLATPPLVIRAEQRASQLGLGLDRPDSWRRLGSADTVVVRQPEDPLRPAVLGAFRALDALGLRTVLVLDETPDATGLDDHALVVPEVDGVVDLWAAVDAVRLVRRVRRLIRQNLLLAGAVILLALPFAASGWLRPSVVAAVAATAVALVVLNSCRIHRFRSQRPPAHRHR
jgi:cation transport ATPase